MPEEVTANLALTTRDVSDMTITWTSSEAAVLASDGTVTRKNGEDVVVELTATVTTGDVTKEKTFTVTVIGKQDAALIGHYPFDGNLADTTGQMQVTGLMRLVTVCRLRRA